MNIYNKKCTAEKGNLLEYGRPFWNWAGISNAYWRGSSIYRCCDTPQKLARLETENHVHDIKKNSL